MYKKISELVLASLLLLISQGQAICAEGTYVARAEERQSSLCQLTDDIGGAGKITFVFNPMPDHFGVIDFNGLYYHDASKTYHAVIHRVTLTKVEEMMGSYVFEGVDETIGGGLVKGSFKSKNDFEVNGYFSRNDNAAECIYYRLSALKSDWAKKATRDNPKFDF